VAAYSICSLVRLTGISTAEAADQVVNETLKDAGADGGVIAIDPQGRISMPFNTPGMYRASVDTQGRLDVAIYRDES
jgi:beta-aspartyl-peptidase (threonine type)